MKTFGATQLGTIALLFFAQITSSIAITFTHDSFISFADLSDDGQDIIVTNCTLTVDGTHAFNSLQILNGAVLTHSPLPYGPQQFTYGVFNEAQTLSATNPATLNNTNIDPDTITVMDASGSITYTENLDYIVTSSNQFTQLTLTTNSAITPGAVVLVDYNWEQNFQGFNLTINNGMQVAAGGAVNVSGKGYAGGVGFINGTGTSQGTNYPFSFIAGGGGAHGGSGGMSSTFARGGGAYDSTTNPATLGSGGGAGSTSGGTGGGVAALFVGGNLQLDGQIIADGISATNAHSGGGAGGTILISAENIAGAGTISANGGAGDLPDGGGGGGGRIAIYYATNNFTGNISSFGGNGSTAGGAGTIYWQSTTNSAGQLFIVNAGKRGTNTTFSAVVSDLTISGGAIAQPQNSPLLITNLFLGSNSWLVPLDSLPLALTVHGDAMVESNALINANFVSGSGAGHGNLTFCQAGSGGSYGGCGGASVCGAPGGGVYGSIGQPIALGSPGGAAPVVNGGGAINMTVLGTLSLAGGISANGASALAPTSGGGSGGSVWLTVGTLLGGGSISANGGSASSLAGGGGGGRVAIYFNTNLFTGNITARGGAGTNAGGAGTIYLQPSGTGTSVSQIIIDNGGLVGGTSLPSPLPYANDLMITGGAVLTNNFSSTLSSGNFFIGSNSWLTLSGAAGSSPLSVTVSAVTATIQSGGGISVDGKSSSSVGAGQSINGFGGGGAGTGNGGMGGTNAAGGVGFGSFTFPDNPGGLGGSGIGPGGLGGGVINLTVTSLHLDGALLANGTSANSINSGGGGGGSIHLSAQTLSGSGIISANGGAGNNSGGGGGGGGIALGYSTNSFSGSVSAFGAAGANYGGAGTIFYTTLRDTNSLVVDNGGNRGAKTPLSTLPTSTTLNLTITGGATVSNTISSNVELGNLLVGSNSTFQISGFSQAPLYVAGNVTVLTGGSINVDGTSVSQNGQGQSLNLTGGGGGNAGSGGASASNAAGGNALSDSITAPILAGSHGGNGFNQGIGGNGGGSLQLTVNGTLRVDGRISADGAASSTLNGGGGSGGTAVLSAAVLSGSGTISANGGAGNAAGGGGGGGRLAISYNTNTFTGSFTAHGGSGANCGGAGIIYTTSSHFGSGLFSQLILDNGGVQGGYTPLLSSLPLNLNLTVTGGAILTNSSTLTLQNLFIGSNSTWLFNPLSQTTLTVQTNATIQAGGKLTADGASLSGPSQGQQLNGTGGGGGHGGYGGASMSNALGGNVTSDSANEPSSAGSRGGLSGGNGGGALRLSVGGALQLDGTLSANGVSSPTLYSGGGSGGAIWLMVGKLSGSGSISVNGGTGNNGGGGGAGGRIAISYGTNLFAGSMTARGGAGGNYGGAGTIYTTSSSFFEGKPSSKLIVDNGGVRGTNTFVSITASGSDFIIGSGASVVLGNSVVGLQLVWNSLTISSNASLSFNTNVNAASLSVTSNLTVQAGGVILMDGEGSAANNGQGHGSVIVTPAPAVGGGGGGHGGYGSLGNQINAFGGASYDSITQPTLSGSGGGAADLTSGSSGGGALHLTVTGVLAVNGSISANGLSGLSSGAGGGSGGSLWLTVGTLSGTGKISVDGGDGEFFAGGGGGAGGRIATYFNSNKFTGTFSARGGAGPFLAGGAGTIYLKTNSANIAQVILDNNGDPGTNTPVDSLTQSVTLSVNNGAAANSSLPLTFQNLSIGPGGVFDANPLRSLNLTIFGNASISPGGAIHADATGDYAETLPGAGALDFFGDGSGGGYGGAGGASFFGASGGETYGSSNQPTSFGSPGGSSPMLAGFSQGGGAIRLNVSGALTVAGSISANGNNGVIAGSGGGSGGSIWITAQSLSGNGSLSANGGIGESSDGGGGGGGRIAIYAGTNLFSGNIFASGGAGAFPGQDGTIYILTNLLVSGSVIDTNGTGIAGLTLEASGLPSVLTDINGFYSITIPPVWTGSITPVGNMFLLPSSRAYSSLSSNAPNQNFLVTSPSDFNLSSSPFDGTNVGFQWHGINGVHYQMFCSTNLVDWLPYGPPIIGSNAPIGVVSPATNGPATFFRLGVSY